jgi:hypothetical protein
MDQQHKTDETPGDYVTQEEVEEALQLLHGDPVMQFEKPSSQIVETEDGFELIEALGWIKLSAAFRARMLKVLKGAKLSIFICVCLHLNERGESFPSITTICEETGYHKDTVIVEIQEMEHIPGLMRVLRQRGKKNFYRPAFVARGKGNQPVGKILPVGTVVGKTPTGFDESSRENPDSKKTRGKEIHDDEQARAISERISTFSKLYESNIGPLTPLLADMIRGAAVDYPEVSWYAEAFKIAVGNNSRHINYVLRVLEGWKTHYFGWKPEFKQGRSNGKGTHENRKTDHTEDPEQLARDRATADRIKARRAAQATDVS